VILNTGIVSWGAFVPRLRLERKSAVAANSWANSALASRAAGTRAFCNWDEDALTMAVEAGRHCLQRNAGAPARLVFASTTPPFADRSSAVMAALALGLPPGLRTADCGGSQRAAVAALIDALVQPDSTLLLASDTRKGSPGTVQEMAYGDAAAAICVGDGAVVARVLGTHSRCEDFVGHFRTTGDGREFHWEERWVRDEGIGKLVPATAKALLVQAGVSANDIQHFVFPTVFAKLADQVAAAVGIAKTAVSADLGGDVGDSGVAHPLLMLAAVLDVAKPGDKILLCAFGSGVDALLLEVTPRVEELRQGPSVALQIGRGAIERSYQKFLSFKGEVKIDFGLRFEAEVKTALTAQYRRSREMAGFLAGRCAKCGAVQFPRAGVCVNPECEHLGEQVPVPLLGERGEIVSFTSDWLSFKGAPPFCFGLVQFDNGARVLMEMTDFLPEQLAIGAAVRCVYRKKEIDTGRHYHSYFWKAAPAA
jgi:hydroxymethylglutaryl-CoA synthase